MSRTGIRRLRPSKEEDAQARAAARLRVGGLAGPVGTVTKENGLGWGVEPVHQPSSRQHWRSHLARRSGPAAADAACTTRFETATSALRYPRSRATQTGLLAEVARPASASELGAALVV